MLSVHLQSGRVEVRRERLPRLPRGFACIRLLAAGICSTDLELQRGYYGFSGTPGHEFIGEVVAVSGAGSEWVGRRVAGEINLACGRCNWCARGLQRHCPARTVLGIVNHPGAFREFLTLPVQNLHPVPASISTEQAVFIEPLAAACEILDQVKIPRGDPVALLGDGKLGLLVAQVLQVHGSRVHLFGRHREKMRFVEKAGVTTELIPKKLPERAYRWVVDATGSPAGLRAAVTMCEPRGTVILKSTVHGLVSVDTAPVIVNEVTLIGSRCGRFEPAMRLLASGKVDVTPLISAAFPLDRAPEAFRKAATKGVLKVILRPPQ
ncbi:MAG: alcohol dehydrogenase catalytic domain-containing protein [Acidobacteriota bacterium]|nr:alcohol dehydrogenase catalytic domain-containing protein [Acidobacteriota bacterium]